MTRYDNDNDLTSLAVDGSGARALKSRFQSMHV